MGQAKRRGPRAIRVQQAIERNKIEEDQRLETRRRELEANPGKARRQGRTALLMAAMGLALTGGHR